MRARLLVIAVLVILPAGCQPDGDGVILTSFDACEPLFLAPAPEDPAALRDSVVRAAASWNERAGTRLLVGDARDAGDAPVVPVTFEDAAPAFLGLYDDEDAVIFINRTLAPARARDVTLTHEVGHAFGLLHVDPTERRSVMNTGNTELDPTDDDVRALQELWGDCDTRAHDVSDASPLDEG